MKTLIPALLSAVVAVALMMAGLGVKMLFRKHGEFKRHCSSIDPYTGKSSGCICGHAANARCQPQSHTPLEVNQELLNEL